MSRGWMSRSGRASCGKRLRGPIWELVRLVRAEVFEKAWRDAARCVIPGMLVGSS
jgi:hypothetical protein